MKRTATVLIQDIEMFSCTGEPQDVEKAITNFMISKPVLSALMRVARKDYE